MLESQHAVTSQLSSSFGVDARYVPMDEAEVAVWHAGSRVLEVNDAADDADQLWALTQLWLYLTTGAAGSGAPVSGE